LKGVKGLKKHETNQKKFERVTLAEALALEQIFSFS